MEAKKIRYKTLDWLRIICAFLIAYDHLGPARNEAWIVSQQISFWITEPLKIIQYFGAFGVSCFLLISGFCANQKSNGIFCEIKKKFVRLIVPMWSAMLLFYIFQAAITFLTGIENWWSAFSVKQWIESAILICHLKGIGDPVNGVLWYMVPLLIFVLLWIVLKNTIAKISMIASILIYDAVILAAVLNGFAMSAVLPFAFMPVFGLIGALFINGKIKTCQGIIAAFVTYTAMIFSFWKAANGYYADQPYIVSFAYAFLLFVIAILIDERIPPVTGIWKWLSQISYSFYLLHSMAGGWIMSILERVGVPYTFCFIAGIIFSVLFSGINWIVFENRMKVLRRQ